MSVYWSAVYEPDPDPPPYFPEFGRGITECTEDCYAPVVVHRWEYVCEADEEPEPVPLRVLPSIVRIELPEAENGSEAEAMALDCITMLQRFAVASAGQPEVRLPVHTRLIERLGKHLRKVHDKLSPAPMPKKDGPQFSLI